MHIPKRQNKALYEFRINNRACGNELTFSWGTISQNDKLKIRHQITQNQEICLIYDL